MYFVPDTSGHCWHGEGVSYHTRHHDHLKTVYMSGFRCYRAQVELLRGILEMAAVLDQQIKKRLNWGIDFMMILIYQINAQFTIVICFCENLLNFQNKPTVACFNANLYLYKT